jgi:hypothetical protein
MGEPSLRELDLVLNSIRDMGKKLAAEKYPATEGLIKATYKLEKQLQAFHDLASRALSEASRLPKPVDWDRVHMSEQAYESGKTTPF